jgi:glutaredoxin
VREGPARPGPERCHPGTIPGVARVTLYGKPGCHLCDDARAALERVRERTPFGLVEIDIESDDALHRAYLERIPVVELDGQELFEHFVDEAMLAARIRPE